MHFECSKMDSELNENIVLLYPLLPEGYVILGACSAVFSSEVVFCFQLGTNAWQESE